MIVGKSAEFEKLCQGVYRYKMMEVAVVNKVLEKLEKILAVLDQRQIVMENILLLYRLQLWVM